MGFQGAGAREGVGGRGGIRVPQRNSLLVHHGPHGNSSALKFERAVRSMNQGRERIGSAQSNFVPAFGRKEHWFGS